MTPREVEHGPVAMPGTGWTNACRGCDKPWPHPTQPTPREAPVREAEWPHRDKPYWPLTRNDPNAGADGYIHRCRLDDEPWPCPSQQYLDGIARAVRDLAAILPADRWHLVRDDTNATARRILEGARATDDEGQR